MKKLQKSFALPERRLELNLKRKSIKYLPFPKIITAIHVGKRNTMPYSLGLGHSFNLPFGIMNTVNKERKYRNHVTACSIAFCTLLLQTCFQMSVQSCLLTDAQ